VQEKTGARSGKEKKMVNSEQKRGRDNGGAVVFFRHPIKAH